MAKNYFNRYIWLIDLIQRSGHISFENINRAWRRSTYNEYGEDLPRRTFDNIKAMLLKAGFHIKYQKTGRILNITSESKKFSLPNGYDGNKFFEDYFGVITTDNGEFIKSSRIRLKVYTSLR